MQTFESYLQEIHGENYNGTDDNMPDAFDRWLTELQVDDLIKYADAFAVKVQKESIERAIEDMKIEGEMGKLTPFQQTVNTYIKNRGEETLKTLLH